MPKPEILIPCKVLKDLYVKNQYSAYMISNLYDCSPFCIYRKLKNCKIKRRTTSKAMEIRVDRLKEERPKRFMEIQKKANKASCKMQSERAHLYRMKVYCDFCGKLKMIKPSVIRKNQSGRFFCSQSHGAKFRNKNKTGRQLPRKNLEAWNKAVNFK